jgi:hypothetical protein
MQVGGFPSHSRSMERDKWEGHCPKVHQAAEVGIEVPIQ